MDLRFGKKKEQEKNPEDEFEELIYRRVEEKKERPQRVYESFAKAILETTNTLLSWGLVFYEPKVYKLDIEEVFYVVSYPPRWVPAYNPMTGLALFTKGDTEYHVEEILVGKRIYLDHGDNIWVLMNIYSGPVVRREVWSLARLFSKYHDIPVKESEFKFVNKSSQEIFEIMYNAVKFAIQSVGFRGDEDWTTFSGNRVAGIADQDENDIQLVVKGTKETQMSLRDWLAQFFVTSTEFAGAR